MTRFNANPMLDSRSLLRDLAVSVGASAVGANREALTEAIGAILRQREQRSLISVLFVDNAHELPADALKFLFARGRSKLGALRVVLLCEPHINTILEAPELQSLRETIVHILYMPSFTLEQTRAYLEARYNRRGLASFLPLDGTEAARIHGGSADPPDASITSCGKPSSNHRPPGVSMKNPRRASLPSRSTNGVLTPSPHCSPRRVSLSRSTPSKTDSFASLPRIRRRSSFPRQNKRRLPRRGRNRRRLANQGPNPASPHPWPEKTPGSNLC